MSKKCLAAVFAFLVIFSLEIFAKNNSASYPISQNERLAIGALRSIQQAQLTYYSTAGNFGAFFQLYQANLIDSVLRNGNKYGYDFILNTGWAPGGGSPIYNVIAVPSRYRKTGIKSFYIDENCEIRGGDKSGAPANINDPVIETCTPSMLVDNERETIASLRAIVDAEMTYISTTGNGNFGLVSDLINAGLIPQSYGFFIYRGYFKQTTVWARTGIYPSRFEIRTRPETYGRSGIRSFYVDDTRVIRGADRNGQYGSATDPPIE